MMPEALRWLFSEAPELEQRRAALGQFLQRAGIVAGDVVKGANKSAADAVSAPVDAFSWGMRKAGIPIGDSPVGSSAWMRETGLVQEPSSPAAGAAGEFLGALLPVLVTAKAPQVAAALNALDIGIAPSSGGHAALQQQLGVMFPDGKARFLADLKAGTGSGTYQLGDVTEGQARQLQKLGMPETRTRDVMMNDAVLRHVHAKRIADEGFSPDEVVRFAEQAMSKGSAVDLDAAKMAQNPALVKRGLRDAVSGRPYDARMPLGSTEEAYFPRTVYPGGLKKRPSKR